ncbi:hypothetical protein Tco_0133602 [Tanacetum coccineum]
MPYGVPNSEIFTQLMESRPEAVMNPSLSPLAASYFACSPDGSLFTAADVSVEVLWLRCSLPSEKVMSSGKNNDDACIPTKAQQRSFMCTYLKNMEGWKPKDLKNKSFANIQDLFDKAMKRVNTFVDMDTELVKESSKKAEAEIAQESSSKRAGEALEQESSKKQKVDDDKETEELKQCMEIISDDGDDVTIEATPLSTKSPTIVDYKIYKEGKKSYFQIIRADGNSQMYLTFGKMLKNFDREDLEVLWSIVKARFKKTELVNYMDIFLHLNLKTMFEHHLEDINILYYLLVEKRYPLTKHTLHQMFNDVKLQVDYECERAFKLLRLVKK